MTIIVAQALIADIGTKLSLVNRTDILDWHRFMAALLFEVPYDAVTSEQRQEAKLRNHNSMYGQGSMVLMKAKVSLDTNLLTSGGDK